MLNDGRCLVCVYVVVMGFVMSGCWQTEWATECFRDIGAQPALAAQPEMQCPAVDIWSVFRDVPGQAQDKDTGIEGFDFTEDEAENQVQNLKQKKGVLVEHSHGIARLENRSEHDGEGIAKTDPGTNCVDINLADQNELMRLPGVGASRAKLIIQAREKRSFKRIKDLSRIKGIGAKSIKKMAGMICEL